jgi:nucleoside-diphosphate-sugar epimerase
MKRILVLGADEFIGRQVMLALAASDWAIPVVDHASVRAGDPERIERRALPMCDASSLGAALGQCQGAVNCLSGRPATIVEGARCLYAAAMAIANPPRIVHVSSMSVYGSATGAIGEDAPLRGDLGAYAKAKVQAEAIMAPYPARVILRPGVEYGPGAAVWSGRIARWLQAGRIGDLGASGDGICNLLYIDDLVTATLAALQLTGVDGDVFNLAMPAAPTWNEYFVQYGRALGAVPVRRITPRALKRETRALAVPLKLLEIAARKLGAPDLVPPPIPPSLVRLTQQEIRLVASRATARMGLRFTPLDEGLAAAAAHYRTSAR